MTLSRAIRGTAWALVAAGAAAPVLRRRVRLPKTVVVGAAATAPAALCVAAPKTRIRDVAVCALQMWAYLAAYEMPNDDPEALRRRVHVEYPARLDRRLGLGRTPTERLQERFARRGRVSRAERVLVWCHWLWFIVPHTTLGYVWVRRPERLTYSAARMYAVFDLGAMVYWLAPTAPPWWAAQHGVIGEGGDAGEGGDSSVMPIRRMMLEYGEEFWGQHWNELMDVLGGNPLAAMPSLHFATSVMGARILSEMGPIAGAVGWAYAGTLGLALVYLGEHYAVDLIAGATLAEAVHLSSGPLGAVGRLVPQGLDALRALGEGD